MLQGFRAFGQRLLTFIGSWYFAPTVMGLAFVPLIFGLIFWLPMGWLPGDWPGCPQNGAPANVQGQSTNQTVFAWLQCGPKDGETNSTTLRNFGLLVAGFYALIFAFWRAKIADVDKNVNLQRSHIDHGDTSDDPLDAKSTGGNFANADFSGSNFEGANFGWNMLGNRDMRRHQDGGEQGDLRDNTDQEIDNTADLDGDPNGGE